MGFMTILNVVINMARCGYFMQGLGICMEEKILYYFKRGK